MLAGSPVAIVSSDPVGATKCNQSHSLRAPSSTKTYTFWDTPGLNEGEKGTMSSREAINNLFTLAQERSINLVIYCIQSNRLTDIVRVNYDLFWRIICKKRVPIVVIVTGLEQERSMEAWWTTNEGRILEVGIKPDGYACVTTTKGINNMYEEEYKRSAERVWTLVEDRCSTEPWRMPPEWSAQVTQRMEAYLENHRTRRGFVRKLVNKVFNTFRRS